MFKRFILALKIVEALHVVQIMDSVILEKDEYIELHNFNDANFVSQDSNAFNQSITVSITNNFENFDFDVNKINECINDYRTKKVVNDQVNELRKTHLYGTPTVFINGKALVGPKPYRVYKSLLNKFKIF